MPANCPSIGLALFAVLDAALSAALGSEEFDAELVSRVASRVATKGAGSISRRWLAMEAEELLALLPAGLAFTPTTIFILVSVGVISAFVAEELLKKYF